MTLDMLDASVVAGWVEEYLGNVKDRGELEGFRELVLMEYDDSDFGRKVSYLGDEALDWCSSIRVRHSEQVRYMCFPNVKFNVECVRLWRYFRLHWHTILT